MTPSTRRRTLRALAIALGTATTGCLSAPGTDGESTDAGGAPESGATPSSPTVYPTVSDAEARERALAAEERYLADVLRNARCLTNWGTTPTTTSETATVVERTAEGVVVSVVHPFWYAIERTVSGSNESVGSQADGASQARYLVTDTGTTRLRGSELTPC